MFANRLAHWLDYDRSATVLTGAQTNGNVATETLMTSVQLLGEDHKTEIF
jgi:hypothetical protein